MTVCVAEEGSSGEVRRVVLVKHALDELPCKVGAQPVRGRAGLHRQLLMVFVEEGAQGASLCVGEERRGAEREEDLLDGPGVGAGGDPGDARLEGPVFEVALVDAVEDEPAVEGGEGELAMLLEVEELGSLLGALANGALISRLELCWKFRWWHDRGRDGALSRSIRGGSFN